MKLLDKLFGTNDRDPATLEKYKDQLKRDIADCKFPASPMHEGFGNADLLVAWQLFEIAMKEYEEIKQAKRDEAQGRAEALWKGKAR